MIDIDELHKTWNTILKNHERKTDAQASRFLDAIQHGKAVIGEVNYKELLSLDIEDVKIIKEIEDLYQKLAETQEKLFGPIVENALKKDKKD
ncbi:hypothetical protein [Treponema sp.]|uniref:hypothetical protein n=1 Tax=Treponema sp. TaxID=166 RepID=UPI0025798228|nr:hypothetical protein [Treponema sp.]MBE6354496.1 hypothetical protein [Treponema sp.]